MKKYSQRKGSRNNCLLLDETSNRTRSSMVKATMLAGVLLISFISCKHDFNLPNHGVQSKVSSSAIVLFPDLSPEISNHFFGINAWLHPVPDPAISSFPPLVVGGDLENRWDEVVSSGAKFIRVGGTSYDKYLTDETNNLDFTNSDILREISEHPELTPIVQLSYYKPGTNQVYTDPGIVPVSTYPILSHTDDAATHLVNDVVIPLYNQGIRYFSIGNEPDKENGDYYNTVNIYTHVQSEAGGIFDYISAISSAIRNLSVQYPGQYTGIKLLGPELTKFDEDLINELTEPGGSYNICQHIDYFTVHYYPFGNELDIDNSGFPDATYDNLVNFLREDAPIVKKRNNERDKSLELRLIRLKERIAASGYPNVKIAITEANLDYGNYDDDYLTDGINYPNGVHVYGTNSFIAGQFWAEMIAVCMSKGVDFINFWSVKEGGQSPYNTNIGYINSGNGVDGNFNSTYYHFQQLANNFSGDFKWGKITADPGITPKPRIKAFASDNSDLITTIGDGRVSIMIMNQNNGPNSEIEVEVRLDNTVHYPNAGVCINVSDANGITTVPIWEGTMPGQSTVFLQYDKTSGLLTQKLMYTSVNNINNESFQVLP